MLHAVRRVSSRAWHSVPVLPAGQTSRVELLLEISSYEGPLPTEGTMQLSWMDWDKEEEQPLGSVELSG